MEKYTFMALSGLNLSVPKAHTQQVITDPGNSAGNIVSSVKGIATASKTIGNILDRFKEVEELYNGTEKYYDTLKKVGNLIGDTYKAREYILMAGDISKVCVTSYKGMLLDKDFCPSELAAVTSGYAKLLEQSDESLKELKSIVESNVFPINDHERMQQIDRTYTTLRKYCSLVPYYTRKNTSVSYIRTREKNGLASVKVLYDNIASRYW